jgi:Tripartite tricarboxylate transporter TctB family
VQEPSPANSARADRLGGLCWLVLGAAILVASLRMDRLASQGVSPYAAPGLMPGLLGIGMMLLGALLAVRAWRQNAGPSSPPAERAGTGRLALVLGLCLVFDIGLVGHGLPFWAAAGLFVTASILALQHAERRAAGQRLTLRPVIVAAVIGIAAGLAVTLVFQGIFLVHLP